VSYQENKPSDTQNANTTLFRGASGIGLATSKMLASRGAKVAISDVQEAALTLTVAAIKEAGGEAMGTVVNVQSG
jgi:NAD(P)-dependent dehydrogenase (short-subunit alcohol dehydrogenase family)